MTTKEEVLRLDHEDIFNYFNEWFSYSESSPSFLVWKKDKFSGRYMKIVSATKGHPVGNFDGRGYYKFNMNKKNHKVHRVIFLLEYGYMPKYVDHKDGNPANNHIDNLRPATFSQNMQNKVNKKQNSSGIKGVYWNKAQSKWVVIIGFDKKSKHLGVFKELADAKNCIEQARIKYHGEFANHG